MGGGITLTLLATRPEIFISAIFGGSGIGEADEQMRALIPPDKAGPAPQEAEASAKMRERRSSFRGNAIGNNPAAFAGRTRRGAGAQGSGQTGGNAQAAGAAGNAASGTARPARTRRGPQIDLTKVNIPVLAFNGEFDRPNAKTHRMWRELKNFTNVVLPEKGHLTAIMMGYMPQQVIDSMVVFITTNNPK
jgi:pimeloyl-ACP methyl ester carboxylesterase